MSAAVSAPTEGGVSPSPSAVLFFAPGVPSTKGSSRGFVVPGKNGARPRAIITNDAGAKAKAWAAVIAGAAHDAMQGRAPMTGALVVWLGFELPRPKAHSTKKGLRPDRPKFVEKKPDIDKLVRCAIDALTGIVFVDDAQIAKLVTEKRYADGPAGAHFTIERIGGPR